MTKSDLFEERLRKIEMLVPPGQTYAMFVGGRLRSVGTGAALMAKIRRHWGRYDNQKIVFLPAYAALEFTL